MVEHLIFAIFIYLAIGFIASIIISFWGVKEIDPAAKESTFGFKILIIPGLCVFWPLFVKRWIQGLKEPPSENNAHRKAAEESEL